MCYVKSDLKDPAEMKEKTTRIHAQLGLELSYRFMDKKNVRRS